MLPFSLASQRTGGVDLAADAVLHLAGGACRALVLGDAVHHHRPARPVHFQHRDRRADGAGGAGHRRGSRRLPYPFAMIIALAASTAFMTPISSPVNTLVVGPGQYRFGDFVKVGVPFAIVVAIVSVLLVPVSLPFG